MKLTTIFLAFVFLVLGSYPLQAQGPQKILGIAKEDKSLAYYEEQAALWCKLTEAKPDNAEAWHYYYLAERSALQLKEPALWANDQAAFYQRLSPILDNAKPHIGEQFEYHLIQGLNSKGEASIQALQRAYAADPDRPEVYGWLFSYYAPQFAETESQDLAQRMLQNNSYSDGNLKWNYNALQTVEKNGVIIANGDMDCLPKWVLQYGAQIRPDVLVISKWLLASQPEYRQAIWQKLQLSSPEKDDTQLADVAAYADYLAAFVLKNTSRPAYISSGTPVQFFRDHQMEDQIYLVGNALRYAPQAFDNTTIMRQNVEEKYVLEHLLVHFQQHPEDEIVRTQMNLTYLPSLVHLRDHYQSIQQVDKAAYYEKLIDKIAEDSGRREEVLNWFAD